MNWKRARTGEQKEQRIAEILEATARLYENGPFEAITLAAIAKESRFTRSNLYKYFRTKEDIFFEFLKHDLRLWRADVIGAFQDEASCAVDRFADIWVAVQRRHRRMMSLVSILYSHLEKRASIENLIDFKRMANDEFGMLSDLICRLFPVLSSGDALRFLQLQLAAAIGLTTMTTLSETQHKVLEMPDFQHFKIDYEAGLRETVAHLLQGMQDRAKSTPG